MRRYILGACLAGLVISGPAHGHVDKQLSRQDAFIAGMVTAIVERELGWARDSYHLEVRNGVATVTLPEEQAARRSSVQQALDDVEGLDGVSVVIQRDIPERPAEATARRNVYSILGVTPDTIPFPTGDLFVPLLADPKQPQFFASLREYRTPDDIVTTAAVGFGETFGFYRRAGKRPGDGLQVSISGGLFAQFNLDAESSDLINADYIIGLPVTYRRGPFSARFRIYHQSSHLGDEFLLRTQPERINLSFESAELLLSYDWWKLRAYAGGEYLFDQEPADLDSEGLHGGLEFRDADFTIWGGHPVAGLDVKRWREHDWSADVSLKAGLEFGATQPGRRRLRIMAEAYDGHAPHGQFYDSEIEYLGLGIYFGF